MIRYSVLLEEDDYVYCSYYFDDAKYNIKLTKAEYDVWSIGKMEM